MTKKLPDSAFDFYAALGVKRSYQAVAEQFGVSKRTVAYRAAAQRWQQRAAELDAKARESTEQRTLETMEEMNERHLKTLRVIQGKALEALSQMPLATAMDAVRALDLAVRQERLIRGEPSERTALSVEEITREEVERLVTLEEEQEEDGDGHDGRA